MVFRQPIYSTATHFPISKNTEVSREQIITLKAVHMRCINASICVSRAYMDLSESPACTSVLWMQQYSKTAAVDGVLGLRFFSLFGFNCKCLITCLHLCSYVSCYYWVSCVAAHRKYLISCCRSSSAKIQLGALPPPRADCIPDTPCLPFVTTVWAINSFLYSV